MSRSSKAADVIVVGAGICGVSAAIEFRARGRRVTLLDPGPLPHPLAASTDVSKAVRMEYGADEDYMILGEQARDGWRAWNGMFGEELYHEVGMAFLTMAPMAPGGFEYESHRLLLKRGHRPERLTGADISRRFPAWSTGFYVDGFLSPHSGYAESGRAVAALIAEAVRRGVDLRVGTEAAGFVAEGDRVTGVVTRAGDVLPAGAVVTTVGAWTPVLVPELAPVLRAVGHPVFHLRVDEATMFSPPNFTVFAADISRTGWYGFPLHPRENILKVANHGVGLPLNAATDPRVVTAEDTENLRAFLKRTFPSIAAAPIVSTRRCLYCDTPDEHFWIGPAPGRSGLTVVAGDSGHGFKFGPLWGGWIADAVDGVPNPVLARFRPREMAPDTRGQEAARFHGR